MSAHENTMDRPPVEGSQASVKDRKQTHRLYPSLPNVDRYEVFLSLSSAAEKPRPAAVHHPDSLPGDTQSEALAASDDVRLKAQILILEEQRQELLSINEKWAKEYRIMKQYYKEKVEDLKALLQLKEEMSEEEEKDVTLLEKVKDKESSWTDYTEELRKAKKEAKELREQNKTLNRRGQHQQEEIRRLNEALEEALQTAQPLDVSSETLRDIWKHQAEVYKEDFLNERKDREKLKGKYLELEKKFRKVHNELRALKPQVTYTRPRQPAPECTCTLRDKSPNFEGGPADRHHMGLHS